MCKGVKDIDNYEFKNLRDAFMLMDKYTYHNLNKKLKPNQIVIFKRIIEFLKKIKKSNV